MLGAAGLGEPGTGGDSSGAASMILRRYILHMYTTRRSEHYAERRTDSRLYVYVRTHTPGRNT